MEKQWQQIADYIADRVVITHKAILNIKEAAIYLGLSTAQLHRLTSEKRIPYSKPGGKVVYFNREELDSWALQNRIATNDELSDKAKAMVAKRFNI